MACRKKLSDLEVIETEQLFNPLPLEALHKVHSVLPQEILCQLGSEIFKTKQFTVFYR